LKGKRVAVLGTGSSAVQNLPNIQMGQHNVPLLAKLYRNKIEYGMDAGFRIFYKDTEDLIMAGKYTEADMKRWLKNHPELVKRLIPQWPVGRWCVIFPFRQAFASIVYRLLTFRRTTAD